ncbi:MAG: hypothetical protein IJK93_06795 [Muribaculaceae bacterium]|nr:hypothetical protein [Muribaculaceae bacterium]
MINNSYMDSKAGRRWHDIAYWGTIAVACIVFLVMNMLTTFKEDDLAMHLIEGEWSPVRSLADFFRSHYCHYMTVNGRSSDIVAELSCWLLGKPVFNVLNTLMFGLLLHMLSLLSTGRRSVMVVAMFLAFVGCFFPVPGETMLWLAGSCNYMWAITLSLVFVYLLQRRNQLGQAGLGKTILLVLFSIVAGSFNEATTFGFMAGLLLYYLINYRNLKPNRTVILMLAGYAIGVIIIACSPAAWGRATSGDIVTNLGFKELLSSRWFIFHEKIWRFYTPVAAILVGIVALFWKGFKTVKQSPWTYILLCLLVAMFALGLVNERAYAALATVGFLIVAIAVYYLLKRWLWARIGVTLISLALFGYTGAYALKALKAYKDYDDQVVKEIMESPSQAVLKERQFEIYTRFAKSMKYMSTDFFDRELVYRSYYGKENVQFVSDSVYERYHSGRLLDGATLLPLKCDHPEIADTIWSFPDQDYMAIVIKGDTLPPTYQGAKYYFYETNGNLDQEEQERRRNYGISAEYTPIGYYPLYYQGKQLLICQLPGDDVASIVISFKGDVSDGEMTLTR